MLNVVIDFMKYNNATAFEKARKTTDGAGGVGLVK